MSHKLNQNTSKSDKLSENTILWISGGDGYDDKDVGVVKITLNVTKDTKLIKYN